ncbi:hypothetical protein HBA55_34970 [Pseudomaricurvus alkylphenolicus]|uniref:hypothetical protein n=1 Tax=Pseudomaricurvus alkylphenolicus TaxID=1306991 RepID=UPI00142157F0|nr:hypothetical protein [Pseudomaricurvus alkylphenolicus]NIB44836.1 hypothetical protein [Pseudomaricurvus alkylphenolicus]
MSIDKEMVRLRCVEAAAQCAERGVEIEVVLEGAAAIEAYVNGSSVADITEALDEVSVKRDLAAIGLVSGGPG